MIPGALLAAFGMLNLLVAVGLYLGSQPSVSPEVVLTGVALGSVCLLSGVAVIRSGRSGGSRPVKRVRSRRNLGGYIVLGIFVVLFIVVGYYLVSSVYNAIPYVESLSSNEIFGGIGAVLIVIILILGFGTGEFRLGGGGGGRGWRGSCPRCGEELRLKKKFNSEGKMVSKTYACPNGHHEEEREVSD